MTNVGERIRYWRKARGLTQQQLADKSTLKQNMIARYEIGYNEPSLDAVMKIATALDISIDALLGYHSGEHDNILDEALLALLNEANFGIDEHTGTLYLSMPQMYLGEPFNICTRPDEPKFIYGGISATTIKDKVVYLLKECAMQTTANILRQRAGRFPDERIQDNEEVSRIVRYANETLKEEDIDGEHDDTFDL